MSRNLANTESAVRRGWSEPEDLSESPLLLLEGHSLMSAPRALYLGAHLFVYIITFLIFSKCEDLQ